MVFGLSKKEIVLLFLYLCFVIAGVSKHEIWFDEMHHWLLGVYSNNLSDLYLNTRYEGHPLLWNALLHLISRISFNPILMQILHVLIALSVIFVFLRYSPFPFYIKLLFILGYFPLYEYAVISRNYAIGILLIFTAASLYNKRYEKPILFCAILALMANTHFLSLLISLSFFTIWIIDGLIARGIGTFINRNNVISILLFSSGIVLSYFQITVPEGRLTIIDLQNLFDVERIGRSILVIWKSFVPFPNFMQDKFWTNNLFISLMSPAICFVLSIVILMISSVILIKKIIPFIFFQLACWSSILFNFLTQFEGARYYGFIYIAFITALWLAKYDNTTISQYTRLNIKYLLKISDKIKEPFLIGILVIHLMAGMLAYYLDFTRPFSHGKNIAQYLHENGLDQNLIVTRNFHESVSMSGYLQQKIFILRVHKPAGFVIWTKKQEMKTQEVVRSLKEMVDEINEQQIILVVNESIFDKQYSTHGNLGIQFLKEFTGSAISYENYFVYQISSLK